MQGIELPPGATRVTVLRHGAVRGPAHVMRGQRDDPLLPRGWAQMETVLARLEAAPAVAVDTVAASPLGRCADFATAWARDRGLPLALLDGFRERAFGAWEGLRGEDAARLDPEAFRLYQASGGVTAPPGGEDVEALGRRVRAAWDAWLGDAAGGHRLLVTHAGVMRALLMDLLGLPTAHAWRIALPEAAHFQVSVLAGCPPVLLHLNPCTA